MAAIESIAAESITCIRGGRVVFRDVSFRIAAGQILIVEGANGSGKTSLLRMLAGFLRPAAGRIEMSGAAIGDPDERPQLIGWLGHQDGTKAQLTPREVLSFFGHLYGVRGAPVEATLERVGLTHVADLPCQYLSAGQKKRVALARLSMCGRPVWLADEPLAALDVEARALVTRMMRAHAESGGIAIIATHDPLDLAGGRLRLA